MKTCLPTVFLFARGPQSALRLAALAPVFLVSAAAAQPTNTVSFSPAMPEVGTSILRILGALILVLSLFLGGVWFFRNWQRLVVQRGRAPRLNVLEMRSLGGRQAIYVVGYQQERFLLASSPGSVNFLTHLPSADGVGADPVEAQPVSGSFAQTLTQVLKGK